MTDGILREKALLLLKRERELLALRQRLAWTSGWLAVSEDAAGLVRHHPSAIEEGWPSIIVDRLKYQQAILARIEGPSLKILGLRGATSCNEGENLSCDVAALIREAGLANGQFPNEMPSLLGLKKFMWCPIARGASWWVAFAGYDERVAGFHPPIQQEDLAYFRVACGQLEALLSQVDSIRTLKELNEELKKNDAALRETREQLLSSTRLVAVGEMAGRTAHEVLNPLTGIQGRVDLMLGLDGRIQHSLEALAVITRAWRSAVSDGGLPQLMRELAKTTEGGAPVVDDDLLALDAVAQEIELIRSQQTSSLEVVRREVDRIAHIVDGLRGLARAGRAVEFVKLDMLLKESLDVVAPAMERRGIVVDSMSPPGITLCVDRYEFIQVVTNLLRNAIQAIEAKGTLPGRVSLEAVQEGELVRVFVRDNGVGIDPEHLPRLFEQQFTTRPAGEGTGLGLSIARRLARAARGDLRLAGSTPGQGTTFVLEIPLVHPETHHGHTAHR